MLLELPKIWIGILNTIYFPVVMISVGFVVNKIPRSYFVPENSLYKSRTWEQKFFEKYLAVRRWKKHLPDGAKMFGGAFPKKNLKNKDKTYLEKFCNRDLPR